MMGDSKAMWARVQNKTTGESGWLNLQTEEVVTDDEMRSLLQASKRGVVCGDPLESTEWISAEKDSFQTVGVAGR